MRSRLCIAVAGGLPVAMAVLVAGCSSTSARNLPPAPDAAMALDSETSTSDVAEPDSPSSQPEAALDVELAPVPVDSSFAEAGAACAAAFAGCTSFTDATAADAQRVIHFQNYRYDPQCLLIRAGQTVTFVGDFIQHPLTPSCGPELSLAYRDTNPSASFTLTTAGLYGYYCLDHGDPQGDAMSGAIQVVP